MFWNWSHSDVAYCQLPTANCQLPYHIRRRSVLFIETDFPTDTMNNETQIQINSLKGLMKDNRFYLYIKL